MTILARSMTGLISDMAERERELRTLAALRETRLPKLISGELRVKDSERLLAEALA